VVFVCPITGRLASVLWRPPGAKRFCSRQVWGRQVAYASQFLGRDSRAHHGKSKLNTGYVRSEGSIRRTGISHPSPSWRFIEPSAGLLYSRVKVDDFNLTNAPRGFVPVNGSLVGVTLPGTLSFSDITLHRRKDVVDQMLYEHAATLSAAPI
jgi:hypothetical protein